MVRNVRTMRSPMVSGGPATSRLISSSGWNGNCSTACTNKPSLLPNQWLTMAASTPARVAMARTVAPS
jgi:hypothetical protein